MHNTSPTKPEPFVGTASIVVKAMLKGPFLLSLRDRRETPAQGVDPLLKFRSRFHIRKGWLVRLSRRVPAAPPVFFLGLLKFGVGFVLGTLHSILAGLRLFLLSQFDGMIDANIALQGFADVDVFLVKIVDSHTEDLIIFKALALRLLYAVQNVGDAVVDLLVRIPEFHGELLIHLGQFFQIRLDTLLESFRSFHTICAEFILLRWSSTLPETLRTVMLSQPIRATV